MVPQPVDHQRAALCRLAEGKASVQILRERDIQIIGLEGVEGDVDLVQSRSVQQDFPLAIQQCSIGGENNPEAEGLRKLQKPAKGPVAQRLAHEMKVQIIGVWAQLGKNPAEFLLRQLPWLPPGTGTEAAAQIAPVGDFQIDLLEPFHNPTSQSFLFTISYNDRECNQFFFMGLAEIGIKL